MKDFCESLRVNAMNIINFKKKKNEIINRGSTNHMKMPKSVIFVKKNLKINM